MKTKQAESISPVSLAVRFARVLHEWLTPAEIATVNLLNASEENASICHSHDVCDPNQAMIDALEELGAELDIQDDAQVRLIDEAWAIAKASRFDLVVIQRAN